MPYFQNYFRTSVGLPEVLSYLGSFDSTRVVYCIKTIIVVDWCELSEHLVDSVVVLTSLHPERPQAFTLVV